MKFPRLTLTFAEDGRYPLLTDAEFQLNDKTVVSRKLVIHPPRKKTFRALCILMLLAKYRGKLFADGDEFIWFKDKRDRKTWIKTLGISFGRKEQIQFFKDYCLNCQFLWAGRGSGHMAKNKRYIQGGQPTVKYQAGQLPLENLQFAQAKRSAAGIVSTPIDGKGLADFAAKLERYKMGKPDGWEPIVPELVAETKRDRPPKPPTDIVQVAGVPSSKSQPFIMSARWPELFLQVRDEIKHRADIAGDWYAVCMVPRWLKEEWAEILIEAVTQHRARVRVAFHSSLGAKHSPAIKAQWRMNSSSIDPAEIDVVKVIPKRLARLKRDLGAWAAEAAQISFAGRSGSFEFFESHIVHPFMGILHVPPGAKLSSEVVPEAPPGTWCLLSLYPFYQTRYERRCGLYLNTASPMLDVYYHSIVKFFEQGQKAKVGYLKRIDLLNLDAGKNVA